MPGAAIEPLAALVHLFIYMALRARYIPTRRRAAKQHRAPIHDLLGVDARAQSVAERIATKIAPGIDTATEHLAVPIDLRVVPELVAKVRVVRFVVERIVFIHCGGVHAGRRTDSLTVPHGRIIGVPIIHGGEEVHAKLTRHLERHWEFVLVVPEYDKFPNQLRKWRTIELFQLINLANIGDNIGEFAAHTIYRIGFFAGSVNRARQPAELVFNESLQHLRPDLVQIDTVFSSELYAALVRQFEHT